MADPIQGTVETTRNPDGTVKTVKETFEVSEAGVQAVRNEIPVGANGQPVMRIPKNPKLMAVLNSGVYVKRVASEDRCLRLVTVPLAGGKEGEFHCSRACVSMGTDGEKYCPEHDPEAFKPQQDHPARPGRVLNSDSIELTAGEQTETFVKDGKKITVTLERGADVAARREAVRKGEIGTLTQGTYDRTDDMQGTTGKRKYTRRQPAAGAVRRSPARKDAVKLEFTLDELSGMNVIDSFVQKAVAALDGLPAGSIAQMKAVVKIQEWLDLIRRAEIRLPEEGK